MEPFQILIVGGAPLFQDGILRILRQDPSVVVAGCLEGLDSLDPRTARGAVIILNTERPTADAAAAIERIAAPDSAARLLVLTESHGVEDVVTTLRLGVHGYGMSDRLDPDDLLAAVRTIARGGHWVCPITLSVLCDVAANLPPLNGQAHSLLSEREIDVLTLAARGIHGPEIATRLQLSPHTVKTYLHRVQEKLEVRSRADAIAQATMLGLIEPLHAATAGDDPPRPLGPSRWPTI